MGNQSNGKEGQHDDLGPKTEYLRLKNEVTMMLLSKQITEEEARHRLANAQTVLNFLLERGR